MDDKMIGFRIEEYELLRFIDGGQLGRVYYAYREEFDTSRAIKLIPKQANWREGWENEIRKVNKLRSLPGVVNYHNHGFITICGEEFLYIIWDYIASDSLQLLIDDRRVTIPIVVDVLEKTLEILHACSVAKIQHADLHAGNVLVAHPNELSINSEQRSIWITDFGYLTAESGKEILDDFKGLDRIIQQCIRTIDFHSLDGTDKSTFSMLKDNLPRLLTESNSTEGGYVRNARAILEEWKRMCNLDDRHIEISKSLGDYLAAEHIGHRYDEWAELFVPKFLSVEKLLERNICVYTGLRGCGKTMIFRRLTALFDAHLGPSGVPGSENFVGFYINARNIAEAFPWLPREREKESRNQVINFFHISWCLEIIEWLKEEAKKNNRLDFSWLSSFLSKYFNNLYITAENSSYILSHISTFLNGELERSRLKSRYKDENWQLTDFDFLDKLANEIARNCNTGDKTFFFFIDDYSTPLVNATTQKILNPIIFRRSSIVFFKIATESTESFEPVGLNGKILEEDDDFALIDNGTQAFLKSSEEVEDILSAILGPRIQRHPVFSNRSLTIDSILGKTKLSNVDLARLIRNEKVFKDGKAISKEYYQGSAVFYEMWSSNTRELISLFAEMVSIEKEERLRTLDVDIISEDKQDTILRENGGRYLNLLASATNPNNRNYVISDEEKSYGNHLVAIARAFQEIASYDLKTKNSKNMDSNPPKQARRIEITGVTGQLTGKAKDYYTGLIRYGVFIRDNRGKSVRGKMTPRYYLRGQLIPHFRLTFSKRDNITMSWEEFCSFIEFPEDFVKNHKKKTDESFSTDNDSSGQIKFDF